MRTRTSQLFTMKMIMPAMLFLLAVGVFPIMYLMHCSMTDAYLLKQGQEKWIGFNNYIRILQDTYFLQALKNTVVFTCICVPMETILGVLLAMFVNSFKKGNRIIRTLILLPMMIPQITVSLMWQIMLSNNGGIINNAMGAIGLSPVNWLMDIHTAFFSIIVIDVWQYTPQTFLLAYAALQAVSQDQYEAAMIDGAGVLQKIRYITLPNIKEGILLVMMLRTIDTFRLFDKVNILTGGGPAGSTTTITQYIYNYGTKSLQTGYASAASMIMTVIVLCISAVYLKKQLESTNKDGYKKCVKKKSTILLKKWRNLLGLEGGLSPREQGFQNV